MLHFLVMFNRQRKVRFERWFESPKTCDKKRFMDALMTEVLMRNPQSCNFLDLRGQRVVYRRYASLFFVCGIDNNDNELIYLEIMHRFVEILDAYFGTVCELDVVFNFEKANYLFDEYILAGDMCESSKQEILRSIRVQDQLQERETKKTLFRNNRVA